MVIVLLQKTADQINQHILLVQARKQCIGFSEQIQKLKKIIRFRVEPKITLERIKSLGQLD